MHLNSILGVQFRNKKENLFLKVEFAKLIDFGKMCEIIIDKEKKMHLTAYLKTVHYKNIFLDNKKRK